MKFKNKFQLTLVILITMANSLFGYPAVANAVNVKALDIKKASVYNKNVVYSKYNNINIKYISIKLYNINILNNKKKEQKLRSHLNFLEQTELLMYSIKKVESNGRYQAKSRWSSACGAYQYIASTWNNYQKYPTACHAPEAVQDARMRGEIKFLWKKYGDWQKVIAGHYMPAYAGNKAKWNTRYYKGQPTVGEYVQKVEKTMNSLVVGLATT